jgi:hypothetical protein
MKNPRDMTDDELLIELLPFRALTRLFQVVGDGNNDLMTEEQFRARYEVGELNEIGANRCLRPELWNQPKLPGYCGPMWGGWRNEAGDNVFLTDDRDFTRPLTSYSPPGPIVAVVTRYETWEAYEMLSR